MPREGLQVFVVLVQPFVAWIGNFRNGSQELLEILPGAFRGFGAEPIQGSPLRKLLGGRAGKELFHADARFICGFADGLQNTFRDF